MKNSELERIFNKTKKSSKKDQVSILNIFTGNKSSTKKSDKDKEE